MRALSEVPWAVVVDDLVSRKVHLAPATYRQYKASLTYAIGRRRDELNMGALAALDSTSQSGCAEKSTQTSSRKAKRFPYADRDRLMVALQASRSPRAQSLIHFIQASCATGLRPIEWWRCESVTPESGFSLKLRVHNSKCTNQRANGETRTLRWKTMSEPLRRSIDATLELMHGFKTPDDCDIFLRALQEVMHDVAVALWPRRNRRPTLYSCRHEFAAQAKARYSPAEVAALMGHHVDATAAGHYGRIRGSKRGRVVDLRDAIELPEPDVNEVKTVARRLDAHLNRLLALKVSKAAEILTQTGARASADNSSVEPSQTAVERGLPNSPDTFKAMNEPEAPNNSSELHRGDLEPFPVPRKSHVGSSGADAGHALWREYVAELRRDYDPKRSAQLIRERNSRRGEQFRSSPKVD
jgi:hypothetical protein